MDTNVTLFLSKNLQQLLTAMFQRGPHVNVKVVKNTKGYNWEAAVVGAESVEQAVAILNEAEAKLKETYG